MGEGISLASIEELERLWYELQRELIASGNVQKFEATVVDNEGQTSQENVVRIGNFNAVTEVNISPIFLLEGLMRLYQDNLVDTLEGPTMFMILIQDLWNLL